MKGNHSHIKFDHNTYGHSVNNIYIIVIPHNFSYVITQGDFQLQYGTYLKSREIINYKSYDFENEFQNNIK